MHMHIDNHDVFIDIVMLLMKNGLEEAYFQLLRGYNTIISYMTPLRGYVSIT